MPPLPIVELESIAPVVIWLRLLIATSAPLVTSEPVVIFPPGNVVFAGNTTLLKPGPVAPIAVLLKKTTLGACPLSLVSVILPV